MIFGKLLARIWKKFGYRGLFLNLSLWEKYPLVLLNPPWAEIKDPARPDFRTLVYSDQWGVDQHIHLAMQSDRPSLSGALRVLNRLNDPAAGKFDGRSPHRWVLTPKPGRGLVAISGPNGLFYANAVGAFGVVSASQNWDRIASATHRWALKLVGGNGFSYYFLTTPWF